MNVLEIVRERFRLALAPMTDRAAEFARMVRSAQDAKFGDYQANCAMPLKKVLGANPREIGERIAAAVPNDDGLFASVDVAGPGFVNVRVSDEFLTNGLADLFADPEHMGIPLPEDPKRIVVDFSSPNVAKPMHVGHLRSTVIGDSIARIHRALGWDVITDNHLGDWGAQFGMLIHGWRNFLDEEALAKSPIQELARLYKTVSALTKTDYAVAESARKETAKLHEGDPENLEFWERFLPWCREDLESIYDRMGVRFDHWLGESTYHEMLGEIADDLVAKGVAEESDGALVVFFPHPDGKLDKDGNVVELLPPAIVRKSDGSFNYATSDLATIRFRVEKWKPDVVCYVVDDRQSLHFQQVFAIAERWGYANYGGFHVAFGKITGPDGKPFKTRQGHVVDLRELLDEAAARARAEVDRISAHLPENERATIAETVGVGSVKYADLSQNRVSDYVFDWEKMIAFRGDAAGYLQYAYARNRNIFRKGEIDPSSLDPSRTSFSDEHERALALALLQYPEHVAQAAADFKPNVVSGYLFRLAETYSGFYENCPVLEAETPEVRESRLVLCELTARTLKAGLDLLGIGTVERM